MTLQTIAQDVLQNAVDHGEIAGAGILVRMHNHEVTYASAGYADIETRAPIRRDSIYRLYSQSKPITAAAALLLCERGQLDLMDSVEAFLPGFRNQQVFTEEGLRPVGRPVRVMDLLGMVAGLCYPGEDAPGQAAAAVFDANQRLMDEGKGLSTVEFANRLGACPLAFQPGASFRYSTCADVLGAVVEVVSGRRFGQFLQEELFEPLGMKDTGFWVPEEKRNRLVTCYDTVDGRLAPWLGQHLCCGRYDAPPAFESGGAGLVSTLDDYAAFGQMLLHGGLYQGKRILSPATVRFMTAPQLREGPQRAFWDTLEGYSYGKLMRICVQEGQINGLTRVGEYGWDGWLGCYFANFPNEQMTLLIMTNRTNTGTAPFTRRTRNAVLAQLSREGRL